MIQQSAGQFTRSAQKATEIVDDKLPDRQRGMWSFLTWSFFLAQAVASHEAFAKGHAAAEAAADGNGSHDGSGDGGAQKGLPPGMLAGVSGFDVDPAAAAQFAAALASGAITPQMFAAFQGDPAYFKAFIDALTGGGAGHADQALLDASQDHDHDAISGSGTDADGGSHGSTPFPSGPIGGITLPGIHLPVDVAIDLGLELGPDLGLGLGVGPGGINLDVHAGSLLNLGLSLGGEGEPLSLGLLGLNVVGGEGSLLSLSGDHGLLPLGSALASVSDNTGLAHDLLDQPLNLASNLASPLLAPLAQPALTLVGDIFDTAGSTGLLASGGSILQTASSLPLLNDLFSQGQHTDYGVELRSTADVGQGATHGGFDSAITTSVDALDVAAIADHAVGGIGDVAGHLLPSVIEELNLRGFGDGFA